MSQFIICQPVQNTTHFEYRELGQHEELLRRAAVELFGSDTGFVGVPMWGGRDVMALFDEAHHALLNQRSFTGTELSRILPDLLTVSTTAAFWWGNDWNDLPNVSDKEEATRLIIEQLSGPVGEVYLRWWGPDRAPISKRRLQTAQQP